MKSNKPMITPIPISKARLKLGELTNKVFRKENVFVLSKSGLPVAAIINMEDFNKLGLIRVEELNSLLRELGREAQNKGIGEKELDQMMDETRAEIYQKSYEK